MFSYYIYVKDITAFMKVCFPQSLCLKQHLSISVIPCWKQRAECACFHSIFPKQISNPVFFLFRPVCFSPRPLCVWSWSVQCLQRGHSAGGSCSGHLVNTGKRKQMNQSTPLVPPSNHWQKQQGTLLGLFMSKRKVQGWEFVQQKI